MKWDSLSFVEGPVEVKAEHVLNDQFQGDVNLIVVVEKEDMLARIYQNVRKLDNMKKTLFLSVIALFSLL